jgi:hypothetical protein
VAKTVNFFVRSEEKVHWACFVFRFTLVYCIVTVIGAKGLP